MMEMSSAKFAKSPRDAHDCVAGSAKSREYPSSSAYVWLSDVNLWCIHIVIVHFSCPTRTGRDWCKLARVRPTQHGHCVVSPVSGPGAGQGTGRH